MVSHVTFNINNAGHKAIPLLAFALSSVAKQWKGTGSCTLNLVLPERHAGNNDYIPYRERLLKSIFYPIT